MEHVVACIVKSTNSFLMKVSLYPSKALKRLGLQKLETRSGLCGKKYYCLH